MSRAGLRAWEIGAGWLALATLMAVQPAVAHVPIVRGRLVDLVQRSDVVVIGTADRVQPVGPRLIETTMRVELLLLGSSPGSTVTFQGLTRFAPGARYVVFLHRTGNGFEGTQASGTVFPASRDNDADYRATIEAIRHALVAELAHQTDALRAALIPALSSSAPELRYHAALELSALAQDGHGPSAAERRSLQQLLSSPACDPALQPLVAHLLAP